MEKTLKNRVEKLENEAGNVHFMSGVVWNIEQLEHVIIKNNKQNEMIKMELRIENDGEWRYEIFKYPKISLNL